MRKRIFSLKNVFLSILPFCAVIFSACNLLQETPGSFLEDYGSIATVAQANISASSTISQGGYLNVGSDKELTITYIIDNPGNHRLRAKVSLPHISSPDLDFPENDYLLQSWTEKVEQDDGTVSEVEHKETNVDEDFLKSTFTLTISQSALGNIDGKSALCDISPIVTLYRADFGEEDRIQSTHTLALRCNTPPQAIGPAVGQMVKNADDSVQTLVLAIKLPTLKDDDKYLIVSALGQTHTFVAPFTSGTSNGWTISETPPTGMEKTWDGGDSAAGIGANCYITTNINIKNRAGFAVDFTLQDEFGLTSKYTLNPSHGAQLSPPYHTTPGSDAASITLEQSESDGMATYTLWADAGTIHYTISQTSGGVYKSGSGASPLAIKLPAGEFSVSATAKKEGFIDSTEFTQNITIEPSVFFVSASGSDTSGDGSKTNPFATITKAHDSFGTLASGTPKILILGNLAINSPVTLSKAVLLQGAAGGTKGSRVTLTANLASGDSAFAISGAVEMSAITLTQATSTSIASGISIASGGSLSLGNVSVTGMNTTGGAVAVEGTLTLNASGNVKITGNTSGGAAKNVYLPTGKTINITALSLTGSQIGVFTEEKPGATEKITITSGYNSAGYVSSDTSHITSDENYISAFSDGEVVLFARGGSVDAPDSLTIVFSFSNTDKTKGTDSGDGKNITIYAFGNGNLLDISDFTTLNASVYYRTVTGHIINEASLKTENPFNIGADDAGTYIISIEGKYKNGQSVSDELYYTISSQP